MDRANIESDISEYINEKKFIEVKRDSIDPNSLYGFPIGIGDYAFAILEYYDFIPNGIQCIPLNTISDVISSESLDFQKFMMESEGLMKFDTIYNNDIPLDSAKDLLDYWNSVGQDLIVKCEGSKKNDFNIGRICSVTDTHVEMLNFDGLGVWNDEPVQISFEKITIVSCQAQYTRLYSKFVDEFPG